MVGDLDPETMKVGTELYMAKQMVTNWTRTEALWMECERNEATYLDVFISPILDAVFSGAGFITHKDDFLPLPEVYRRSKGFKREDFKLDSQHRENGFPIVVMEAKPFTAKHLTLKDELKLCNMVKLSLDLMMDNGVEPPTVVGILVQRDEIEILIMDLPHEAFYPAKSLGTIKIHKTPQELNTICDGQSIILTAKVSCLVVCLSSPCLFHSTFQLTNRVILLKEIALRTRDAVRRGAHPASSNNKERCRNSYSVRRKSKHGKIE
ncbi:hypothetical protein B0O80DRAFT_248578 [Mortierella sp. GBAus27b]|nr:hypothetical protein B0O80DRAFT_248578 [Mortierella sp. GBAus27b]